MMEKKTETPILQWGLEYLVEDAAGFHQLLADPWLLFQSSVDQPLPIVAVRLVIISH